MPKKVLNCSHTLYNICIKIYKRQLFLIKYNYYLLSYILCALPYRASNFQFVPPSTGIRILSIDGKDIKGVISLIFLMHIKQILSNFRYLLQEHFNLIYSTSAGI